MLSSTAAVYILIGFFLGILATLTLGIIALHWAATRKWGGK